jgi:hypothetical protein
VTTPIRTYKLPATETQGERVQARYGTYRITRPWDYGSRDPHVDVAREMAERIYGEGVEVEMIRGDYTPTGYKFRPVEGTYHV